MATLEAAGLAARRFTAPYLNEVALHLPAAARRHAALAEQGIVAGLVLEAEYPELPDTLLLAATELTTDADIDRLATALGADGMSAVEERTAADASGRGAAFSSPTPGAELVVVEPTLFERSRPGRRAVRFPPPSEAARASAATQPPIPDDARRTEAPRLPEINELELVRHFNRLSRLNHAIDIDFYPLGSCTMKYNPKLNEWAARLPGLAGSHPLDPPHLSQGSLELQWLLAELLAEIGGFAAVSLQPAAGAHGELTGMLMARAFHRSRGEG